jgi:hypothetical protein
MKSDEYARIEDVAKNENEKPKEFVPLEQKIDSNVEREQTSPGETIFHSFYEIEIFASPFLENVTLG